MAAYSEKAEFDDAEMFTVVWETKPEIVERLLPFVHRQHAGNSLESQNFGRHGKCGKTWPLAQTHDLRFKLAPLLPGITEAEKRFFIPVSAHRVR